MQTQIELAELTKKLEAEDYPAIKDAVFNGIKKPYQIRKTDAALFLILESMGGTWCVYLQNKAKRPPAQSAAVFDPDYSQNQKEYQDKRDVILRQMLCDLSMWFSISNAPKRTSYMSHHVQQFIDKFELTNDEEANGDAYSSDDDTRPDPGNPPPARTKPPPPRKPSPAPRGGSVRRPSPTAGPTNGGRKPVVAPEDPRGKTEEEKTDELNAAFAALQTQQPKPTPAADAAAADDLDVAALQLSVSNARFRWEDEPPTHRGDVPPVSWKTQPV